MVRAIPVPGNRAEGLEPTGQRAIRQEVVFPVGPNEFTRHDDRWVGAAWNRSRALHRVSHTLSRAIAGRNRLQFAAAISM